MFGRRKRAREQAAVERRQQLDALARLIDDAAGAEDPGERLFRLEELREAISDVLCGKKTEIEKRADKRHWLVFLGGNTVLQTTTFALLFATGGASLMLLPIPVLFGSLAAANKASKNTKKRLEEDHESFFNELRSLEARAGRLADKVLEERLDDIARSTKRDLIFERFPDVKSRFGEAAARKLEKGAFKPKPPGIPGADA